MCYALQTRVSLRIGLMFPNEEACCNTEDICGRPSKRGTDMMDAAEYNVAISGSLPCGKYGAKASLADISLTMLLHGMPYKVSSISASTTEPWRDGAKVRCAGGGVCDLAVAKVSILPECFLCPDKPGEPREGVGERSRSGLLYNCSLVLRRGGTFQRVTLELLFVVQTS